MYNLSNYEGTQITTNKSIQYKPDLYSDRIVWNDNRNGNWDIYMYNLSTHWETQITTNKSDQISPAIYSDRVVWADDHNSYGSWDIYMDNLGYLPIAAFSAHPTSGRATLAIIFYDTKAGYPFYGSETLAIK